MEEERDSQNWCQNVSPSISGDVYKVNNFSSVYKIGCEYF